MLVHWQMREFPTRVAKKLLAQRTHVLWVVATTERGDIAERQLSAAGIDVRRFHTEATDFDGEELSDIALLRRRLKRKAAALESSFPPSKEGTVTIVPIGRLEHARPLQEVASWDSPLVVFDHLGVVNARWMRADVDEDEGEIQTSSVVSVRQPNEHPIPAFHQKKDSAGSHRKGRN